MFFIFQMFFKIGDLKNSGTFTGKIFQLESPFNENLGLHTCNFMKNRLQHSYFPVTFAKISTTSFLTEHRRWLLLNGAKSLQFIHFLNTRTL